MSVPLDLLFETEATGLRVLDATQAEAAGRLAPGLLRVGVHRRAGSAPSDGVELFDILLTLDQAAGAPWVSVEDIDTALERLEDVVRRQPLAAAVTAQVFRLTLALPFDAALLLESFAYGVLLASPGFREWRETAPPPRTREDRGPRVRLERSEAGLEIVLNRPRGRNAVDAAMRDTLCEALAFAAEDSDRAPIRLWGEGAVFSVGGDLAEFGQAQDPAAAHAIRTLRSVARLLYAVRDRTTAVLHGPCVGAGVEIPLAAGRVVARPGATLCLPEVTMGLMPGAGGSATIARRAGRQRACWMAITGRRLDLDTATAWGLVDEVEP